MLFCTYCGKSFTRKEHLERHIPRRESSLLMLASSPSKPVADQCYSDTNVMPAADRSPYTSLIMKTPEILPKDTTRRTTRPKTPCSLHRATSPRLLAFIVQVRKPVVTKEFPARGVQRKICPVKPALLGDAVQQDLFDHQRPRKAFRVRTLMVGS